MPVGIEVIVAELGTTISEELQKSLWFLGPVQIATFDAHMSQICLLSLPARLGYYRVKK